MPLTPEEEAELAELEKQLSPEFLKAVPSGGSVTPAPKNSLGVTGVINQPEAPLSPEDSEVGRIASALDPRFDLIPQGLALLPATNDTRGVEGYKAGSTGPVKWAFEPPVAVVRKQLLENPNMLRLLRSDPPSPEEIAAMDSSSPIYQDAANYMWARTMEAADKGGYQVYRHSKMPWGQENNIAGGMSTLGLKLGGMMQPIQDIKDAFVLGFDDTAALGASRAIQETAFPEQKLYSNGFDVMGVDEDVPQKTADVNAWTAEDSPLAYGMGQGLGAVVGAPRKIYQMIVGGGDDLARAAAKTRLGDLATRAPSAVNGAAGLAGEVGAGAAEAAITQAGQEAVDATAAGFHGPNRTREPVLGAGERILDTAEDAALWGLGGSALGRLAGSGADFLRNADRLGGAIGRTESSMRWGPLSPFLGPGLQKDVKATVKQARKERHLPGDYIAQEIQPAMAEVATKRATSIEAGNRATREQIYGTTEGRAALPVTRLQETALKEIRAHHQPTEGKPHAVNEKSRPAIRTFNQHIADVSTEPIEGAIKLSPSEVDTFLNPHWRHRLWQRESEAAAAARESRPPERVERDAYLRTVKDARRRTAVDDEIEDEIEERLQDRGGAAAEAGPGDKVYDDVEQAVLAERVEEEAFEETNGGVGDWLRRQGKGTVYVVPYRYDAERVEKIIQGLPEGELLEAALADRKSRSLRGEAGGWSRLREEQDTALEGAQADAKRTTFENVAKHQTMRPADKNEADLFRGLAREAGVEQGLDRLRNVNEAVGLQRQAWGRGMEGEKRAFFSPQNFVDTAYVRAFPVLRALEPGGDVTGGMMSRMALMGQIEEEKARADEVERAKPAYEKRRADLQKDKDREREKAKKERARRRTEKHRDD